MKISRRYLQFARLTHRRARAFTLAEIAICLGIIGFALVIIIGILPAGFRTQRQGREETIVNQDASVIFEAVRNGSRGADDLTNYIYAIINTGTNLIGYTNELAGRIGFSRTKFPSIPAANWHLALTNGENIIGLLSTPEYIDGNFDPTNNVLNPGNNFSNHITAFVTAMSGVVSERPPQDNDILRQDTFGYRIYCVNAAVAVDTNIFNYLPNDPARIYAEKLARNQHELRMTFLWPLLPNGDVGKGRQTYRATVAGQLAHLAPNATNAFDLYFYQSQSFTNTP